MTDIVFIHPNASKDIYQDLSNEHSAIETPIWAYMLSRSIKLNGYSSVVIDCEAGRLTDIQVLEKIRELSPKYIAIVVYGQQPSASTQNMVGTNRLSKYLNDNNINNIVILGAHPSALPELTKKENPWATVIKGEGLYTLLSLLKNEEPKEALIQDLDKDLPGMDLEAIDFNHYRTANWHALTNNNIKAPFASIYTSLGCPFNCTFCMINAPFGGSSFRYWSPEHTIKQLDYIASKNVINLKIADEMFVLQPRHFLRLSELIIERGHKFNIWAYARVDTIKDKYLETLRKAGFRWLGLGVESANKKVRLEIDKGRFEDTSIVDIVKKVQSHDICVGANYIFGLPEDTYETMQETLDLAISLNTEYANFYSAMAYPGSYLHKAAAASRPQELPENTDIGWIGYSQHAYNTYNLPNENLTRKEILNFRDQAIKKYFSRDEYKNMLRTKFGQNAINEIDRMLSVKVMRNEAISPTNI